MTGWDSRMKDCFMGLRSGGGWLTFCAAIVSSSTFNSSSSSSTLSLGLCRMVRSISISSGRTVGFLDLNHCMNRTKFGSYSSFSTAVLMSLELGSIAEGCALDFTRPALDHHHRTILPQTWNNTETENNFFFS
jgi:hypothetical protein